MSCVCENMKYNTLKEILKEKIREVTLQELYDLSFEFNEDTKYLPREYKKKYIETVLNVIINRFNSLKNTQENFEGEVTKKEASEINKILTKTNDRLTDALNVIVVYATYLKREPIHLPGTEFPGMQSIYTDGENYYCPIKRYHIDNDKALCRYCVAKETDI